MTKSYNDWLTEELLEALLESTSGPSTTMGQTGGGSTLGAASPYLDSDITEPSRLPEAEPNEEMKRDTLSEEAINPREAAKMVNLFKLQISENWGKLDTVERSELQRVVRTATAGQTTVFGRLEVIQRQMNELREGTLGKIKNPRRILSQIILLETFNRLFKGFQPSPAGFINESLLSVFYNSTQEDAGEANKEAQIGDVIASDGSPISIKTKVDGGAQVDGSIRNLYHSLNGSKKTGKVYFDIFLKKSDGKKDVGSLTFIRFFVDSSNINQFLNLDLFDPDPEDPRKVKLKHRYRNSFLAESLNERRGIAGTNISTGQIQDLFLQQAQLEAGDEDGDTHALLPFNFTGKELASFLSEEAEEPITLKVIPALVAQLLKNSDFRTAGQVLPSEEAQDIYNKYMTSLAKIWIQARGKKKIHYDPKAPSKDGKGKIETDFDLAQGDWMKFALSQDAMAVKPIVLTFDDESIERTIEAAVADIDVAITDMFNGLATFTGTVQTYLTTIASNRAAIGEKATTEANELPQKTERVVDVAGTDPADDENE